PDAISMTGATSAAVAGASIVASCRRGRDVFVAVLLLFPRFRRGAIVLGQLGTEQTFLDLRIGRRKIGQRAVHVERDSKRNHWSTDLYTMVWAEFRLFKQAPYSLKCSFPQCLLPIACLSVSYSGSVSCFRHVRQATRRVQNLVRPSPRCPSPSIEWSRKSCL